jgi:hypothetical protein
VEEIETCTPALAFAAAPPAGVALLVAGALTGAETPACFEPGLPLEFRLVFRLLMVIIAFLDHRDPRRHLPVK